MGTPSIPLLHRLRCISRPWNQFVMTTVEWNAWVFLGLDSRGYCRYVTSSDLDYQTFSQRFEREVAAFRFLMAEDFDELAARVRFFSSSTGRLPHYISLTDCPPSVDICPEYYGL